MMSCSETKSVAGNSINESGVISRPTVIRLQYTDGLEDIVRLRWNGAIPEMDVQVTPPGKKWITRKGKEEGVFFFSQTKSYELELNFREKTFVESGFDGVPLPEIAGSWSAIR